MNALLARCGYRCDLCPAFRANIQGPDDQQRISDGWFKYYGFRIPPARILCDGCLDPSPTARRIDSACPVRSCVLQRGFSNCAPCAQLGCREYESRAVARAVVERHIGAPLPTTEYVRFVAPYERLQFRQPIRRLPP